MAQDITSVLIVVTREQYQDGKFSKLLVNEVLFNPQIDNIGFN